MLYQEINILITDFDAGLSAAESHGMASGMLCINHNAKAECWLGELSSDYATFSSELNDALVNLFEETRRLLINEDLSFDILLPDDDKPLRERLKALKEWCHGFLFGIGTTHRPPALSPDSKEIVKDIAEFTKLETDACGDESENDFMELTEYLRTSVIYLRTELNATNNSTTH
jgi:uncharacterized protein YgfB (UPF0149 family)